MNDDQFRQSNSSSAASAGPPRSCATRSTSRSRSSAASPECTSSTTRRRITPACATARACMSRTSARRVAPAAAGRLGCEYGLDFDAMPDTGEGEADDAATGEDDALANACYIPNGVFRVARILVNLRCVTTYAGVSHAQLALDLFGPDNLRSSS
ncbi:hypothetical protein DFH11DRAFT_92087 [Phellopilus nigrolimitatus]|nr:hypothetical protein DFH11DRAFT_92087 [Phellopilus nigrolimitatus]